MTAVDAVSSAEFTVPAAPNPQPCFGDSGGPAFAQGDRLYLVGVASRAALDTDDACAQGAVYTRVDVHADWIQASLHDSAHASQRARPESERQALSCAAVVLGIAAATLWVWRRGGLTRSRKSGSMRPASARSAPP
jgi:secreted trypsin-like serine protease